MFAWQSRVVRINVCSRCIWHSISQIFETSNTPRSMLPAANIQIHHEQYCGCVKLFYARDRLRLSALTGQDHLLTKFKSGDVFSRSVQGSLFFLRYESWRLARVPLLTARNCHNASVLHVRLLIVDLGGL